MGGDSACLLHAFSYTSGLPSEPTLGNPITMHGLGDSISLGRFMSESLGWEKWSTFSHNRYVEEAERYARPGSVAQKKAFFEAHYKRIAAQKAAALLEQALDNANSAEAETDAVSGSNAAAPGALLDQPPGAEAVPVEVESENPKPDYVTLHEQPLPPPPEEETEVNARGSVVNPTPISTDERVMGSDAATPLRKKSLPPPPPVAAVKKDSSKFPDNLKNQEMMVPESDAAQMEKPLLQQVQNFSNNQDAPSVKSKKKSAFSSLKSSVYPKSSRVPCAPAKPIATPRDCIKEEGNGNANYATTPIIAKKQKHALDFKRSTPKSPLRSLINSTPLKQLHNVLSPASGRKPESSTIAPDPSKPSHKCTTPVGLQKTGHSATTLSKHLPASTPCSANTRFNQIPFATTQGTSRSDFDLSYSRSLAACRNKLQSPTISTPFILRTEERAARRKQKLEERFNSKEVDNKVQQQNTLKEKAELELRKLRQSFCFKARPLPDFYKEREAQNNQMKKNLETRPKTPKMGKKPSSTSRKPMQGAVSPPPSTISLHKKANGKRV